MAQKSFDEINEEMFEEFLLLNPDVATNYGLHDPYDRFLPQGGFKRFEDTKELLRLWNEKAVEAALHESLSRDQQLCIRYLERLFQTYSFIVDDYPKWKMYPDALVPISMTLFRMFSSEYAPFEERFSAASERIGQMPKYLAEFRTRFTDDSVVRMWVKDAIGVVEQFTALLRSIAEFSKGRVPENMLRKLDENTSLTESALRVHLDWLNSLLEMPDRSFAMGRDLFSKLLSIRGFSLSSDEIVRLGQGYLAELKAERKEIVAKLSPSGDLDDAVSCARLKSPRTFEEALEFCRSEIEAAREFLVQNGILTIDADARLETVETPGFLKAVVPFAACEPPSRFHGVPRGEMLLTPPANAEDLMERLNYAGLLNTLFHEAYPGHFHQFAQANQKHWIFQLGPMMAGADMFGICIPLGYECIEGWALYCERMMLDRGFRASDELQLETSTWAILRACRVVGDVKLAIGEASIDEMVAWVTNETHMPKEDIEADVRCYTRSPSYFMSQMTGLHLILGLKKELETKLGSRFSERRFHDLIASYGCLPFDMMSGVVKSEMMGRNAASH